jgi:isoquinoline 1-oxidoreductase subunit alpha
MPTTSLVVNGRPRQVEASPEMPLLWVLRDVLALTGTKFGCGVGLCGACTIHLDGEAARACQTSLGEAAGRRVTTIEGLSAAADHPLQRAWLAEEVVQCGYCQSGQFMAAAALLARTPRPSDADIDAAMDGILCRCGTYNRIRRAIHRAAGGTP